MNQVELKEILLETGMQVAYMAFREKDAPEMPFLTYQETGSDNFGADNRVYFPVTKIQIDLFCRFHNEDTEKTLEGVLDQHDLYWEREPQFESEEDYYRVTYEVTI